MESRDCSRLVTTELHRHNGVFIMLVLSRKKDEKIVIGDDIWITVNEIRSDKCRLGIIAPGLSIHRREIYEAIATQGGSFEHQGGGGMLVLSRKRDESIVIGDEILITVVDIRGDKVRVGIAAPIEISVHRQEVYEAIQRENRRHQQEHED